MIDSNTLNRIRSLPNDSKRAWFIVNFFQDDDSRIQAMDTISDEEEKSYIILSLKDDKKKIEQLQNINDELNKVEIIMSLQDDSDKMEELKKIECDSLKVEILGTFESDEYRVMAVETITDDDEKANGICTIEDNKERIKMLKKLVNEYNKAFVIERLREDNNKIEQLNKIVDEDVKAHIIGSLEDDEKKIKQNNKLKKEANKAYVITTLKSKKIKKQQIEKLSDKFLKSFLNYHIFLKGTLLENKEELKQFFTFECKKFGLDDNLTIGIEIETEGLMFKELLQYSEIIGWKIEFDGSLNKGVELISPILKDDKENIEEVYIICSLLKKLGLKAGERCGGHIHIGSDYLTTKESYKNLIEIWGNAEKIIYLISNEEGNVPRMGINQFARPVSYNINNVLEKGTVNLENEEDLNKFINKIKELIPDRHSGINLLNINKNRKNTIEFRVSNGTLNPDTWIHNVKLFGRIVQISEKIAQAEIRNEFQTKDKKLIELLNKLKEENDETEKMEILLDLLFSEDEKEVYRKRYYINSKILENTENDKNSLINAKFSRVNIKNKKHELNEFFEVASIDRSSNVDAIVRRNNIKV